MQQSRSRIFTTVALLLGVVMIGGGAAKLLGQSAQVAAFARWGPSWFRALVGTFEVVGGVGLAVPATRPAGSAILATIMVGALRALFLAIFQRNRSRAMQLLGGA